VRACVCACVCACVRACVSCIQLKVEVQNTGQANLSAPNVRTDLALPWL
jgi:hypothetical protein